MDAAASFCPLVTPIIPALTHSAIKVSVYNDNAAAKAINSGIIATPPTKLKLVCDSCVRTGYSKLRETPPTKKVNNCNIIIIPTDLRNFGVCIPVCSCFFLA